MDTGAGAQLHHIVGSSDSLLIMLHHNKGVADIPQVLQGIYKLLVVPLVETYGRLIQYIEDTH